MKIILATLILVSILVCSVAARAEDAAECPAHVLRWVSHCQSDTGLIVEPVSCPQGIVRIRLHPLNGATLDVELNSEPQRSFRSAGTIGVSPILNVADFSKVDENRRRVLERFIEWIESHQSEVSLTELARAPRVPEPAIPNRVDRPTWLRITIALLTFFLLALYLRRGQQFRSNSSTTESKENTTTAPPFSYQRYIWAAIVFLCALFASLIRAPIGVSLHQDTIRDLLIVREWVEGPTRIALGSVSSMGFYHGFMWHRTLAGWQLLDPGMDSIYLALSVVIALSALLIYLVIESRTSPAMGLIGVSVYLVFTLVLADAFSPLWQPTLSPELSCFLVFAFGVDRNGSYSARFPMVLGATVVLVASQFHLVYLFFLPGIVLTCRKDLLLSVFVLIFLAFTTWDAFSYDALGANVYMLSFGLFGEEALESGFYAGGYHWQAVLVIFFVFLSFALWWVQRGKNLTPGVKSCRLLPLLNAMLVSYFFFGLLLFNERALHTRYWTPTFVLSLVSITLASHRLVVGHRRGPGLILGAVIFMCSIIFLLSLGKIHHEERITLDDLNCIVDAFEDRGLSAEESYRAVSSIPPLSDSFGRGIWLRAPCQKTTRRLGLQSVDQRYLLFVISEGVSFPSVLKLQTVFGATRSFGILPFNSYVETNAYHICFREKEQNRCYRGDRSFPNPGWKRMCFVGDWGTLMNAPLVNESREIDIEFDVFIPAGGSDHAVFFPSIDDQRGRVECRGQLVAFEGVQADHLEKKNQLILRGSSETQTGRIRVRWPWFEERCNPSKRSRPMPFIELELDDFLQLRPYLETTFIVGD